MRRFLRNDQRGAIGLIGILLYSAAILVTGSAMVVTSVANYRISNERISSLQSLYNAESGAEDALIRVSRNPAYGLSATDVTTNISSNEHVDTTIQPGDGSCVNSRKITSSGYVKTLVRRIQLRNCATTSLANLSFGYAVQVDKGGVEMRNNSIINGTLYSNGNLDGSNGASITGSTTIAGAALADPVTSFDPASTTDYIFANSSNSGVIDVAESFTVPATEKINKVSLKVKRIGNPSNATVRITTDNNNKPSTSTVASGSLVSTSVGTDYSYIDVSMTSNPNLTAGTKYWVVIDASSSSSNYWSWAQSNTYGSGEARYSSSYSSGNWSNPNTDFAFKAYTGNLATYMDNIRVGGTGRANTIKNSTVTGEGYYQTLTNSTIGGAAHPNSADPSSLDMPISDGNVADFKNAAESGGTWNGDYNVNSSAAIGPLKINGNLTVNISATLTINGPVWVTGDVTFNNGSILEMSQLFGPTDSTYIVSDGKITMNNNVAVNTPGPDAYVMLLSESTNGIDVSNNAQQSILVTRRGPLTVTNNAGAHALVAYRLVLLNNVSVSYVSGIPNLDVTGSPGAKWSAQGWKEVICDDADPPNCS